MNSSPSSSSKFPKSKLKLLYLDILRGYSKITVAPYGNLVIKHFTTFDLGNIELKQEELYQEAKNKGLPSATEKENYLIQEGFWTQKQNDKIHDLQKYIDNLKLTKSKTLRSNDIHKINREINKHQNELTELEKLKTRLIDFVIEVFVSKRINEYYIYCSFYKNNDLKESFFSEEEFNNLDDESIERLVVSYNNILEPFSEFNLKRISLSPYFFNFFGLVDNSYSFYGVPAVHLTFYQADLFNYGRFFKNILSNCKVQPSQELMDEPDKLIEWFESSVNLQKELDETKNKNPNSQGVSSLVGLSKEDHEKLNLNPDENIYNKLVKEAQQNKGDVGFNKIMNIIGTK